jgi:predicted nucleic acid-binding protein
VARVLVDTNVLVYAHDASDPTKQERAIELLAALARARVGCLSAQNLAEFFWTVTRSRRPLLTVREAAAQVDRLAASWPILDVTAPVIVEAATGVREHRFSYWDAQVWAAARLNQVTVVLSEDFADGSRVGGVRFVNPFAAAFDARTILPIGGDVRS